MCQPIRAMAAGLVLTLVVVTPCEAQSARRWEVEGHGGLSWGSVSSDGTAALPPAGAPIPSISPLFPSRRTSSWFFGDGAEMLNGASADLGLAARITALDAALRAPGLDYATAAVIGVRVRRVLTPRFSAEVTFDLLPGSGDVSPELFDAAETTQRSFEAAFRELFDSGPFAAVNVTTQMASLGGSARELLLTGALNWQLGSGGSFAPYLTFGGGLVTGTGDLSSIAIEGTYEFLIVSQTGALVGPYHEADRMRMRFERGTSFVGLAGAGVRHDMSDRWGFRIDGRFLIGQENSRLLIDASPDVRLTSPGDFIESLTNPNIQFSNSPATGRQSTLGGEPIEGFVAFKATGIQTRVLVTVGVFVTF